MYEIGDIVLSDIYVGVVVEPGDVLTCNCSDGNVHKFHVSGVSLVTSYKVMLDSFRKGILSNAGG